MEAEAATCQLNARSRVQKPTVTDARRRQHTQHNPSMRPRLNRPRALGQYSRRCVCRGFQYLCVHVAQQDVLHCGCTHAKLQQITHRSRGELGSSNAHVASQYGPSTPHKRIARPDCDPGKQQRCCARELIIIAAHDQHRHPRQLACMPQLQTHSPIHCCPQTQPSEPPNPLNQLPKAARAGGMLVACTKMPAQRQTLHTSTVCIQKPGSITGWWVVQRVWSHLCSETDQAQSNTEGCAACWTKSKGMQGRPLVTHTSSNPGPPGKWRCVRLTCDATHACHAPATDRTHPLSPLSRTYSPSSHAQTNKIYPTHKRR